MIGPSIAAGLTSHLDAFSVMLPGLWCQALSPLLLAYYPSIGSAIVWVAFLSIGEVIWSPRQSAWVANLAPDGREGVFLALLSLKSLLFSYCIKTIHAVSEIHITSPTDEKKKAGI